MDRCDFLPVSAEEMHERGWWWYDALVVGGDAYVDHPSFGTAVISRVLEAEGLRVAVLAQPDWHDAEAFRAMAGRGWSCSSARAISTPWSRTTRRPSAAAARIFTPPASAPAAAPTAPPSSTATARARPSAPMCRSFSARSRRACAALRTMTTGTIPCAAPSSLTPRPTCWSTAWARPQRSRSPTG